LATSLFKSFEAFIMRRRKIIIVVWVLALIISATQIPVFFGSVSYNLANSSSGMPTNTESQEAQNVLSAEFPANASSGSNTMVVVMQPNQAYSDSVKAALLGLNRSIASDPALSGNFTGMDSVYSTEYSLLVKTVPGLLQQVSALVSEGAPWDTASELVSNATASAISAAPLFHANATSLAQFLSTLNNQTEPAQVRAATEALVVEESVGDYPLPMTRGITQNFVSQDNKTVIAIFNFASMPDKKEISAFQSDVGASAVGGQGPYWVTGSAVVTQDVSTLFGPAVTLTLIPGVIASLIVVGLLLLSPLAALVPVMVGGFSIAISLPLIYLGVVKIGHGTLEFLTPTLTILLVLGLSVDYSVLQLRRTREERLKGKSKEESVATSLRWAGQAVLTAGVTVVVAYLVMSVTKVPLFSDVGTSIAIAVSILIAAALTLLPALELTLGDRIFWPSLSRARPTKKPSRIKRLTEGTLHRKVAVILVVSALAVGAFFIAEQVPAGADFFKLLPGISSFHGITVITDNFGSDLTGATFIVITLPTPITYGADQLNQTLLNDIEMVTSTAAGVNGVETITSPTRPYGSAFNFTGLQQMPQQEQSEYLAGLLSNIGRDNRTAVINIGLKDDPQSQAAINVLLGIESRVNSLALPMGTAVYYGGTTQSTLDSQSFIDDIIPQVILTLAVAIYVILLIQLRSAFTPLRLILTILSSVAFALAVLVLIFYYALSLPVFDFAPLFVVVTMLGVGIDYDIFLVTRIREEVLSGKTDDEAIKTALSKSWVTIFGLGLVLSTVFASVVFTGIAFLQQIGLVVALAVMIDVSTVILFFVPALMGLAQRYNWWPWRIKVREGSKTDSSVSE
jgi:RND superfamily putative drug exporter